MGDRLPRVTAPDEVNLAVPAMPEFLRLVRVTAAGLGSRLGFSYDQVEDLRLAMIDYRVLFQDLVGGPGETREGTSATEPATVTEAGDVRVADTQPELAAVDRVTDGRNPQLSPTDAGS